MVRNPGVLMMSRNLARAICCFLTGEHKISSRVETVEIMSSVKPVIQVVLGVPPIEIKTFGGRAGRHIKLYQARERRIIQLN